MLASYPDLERLLSILKENKTLELKNVGRVCCGKKREVGIDNVSN